MAIKMTNNAASTLASNVSSGATSFTVVSGSTFPSLSSGDHTYVTIGTEVIKVTAISSANFTCIATGAAHSAGDTVELRVTAELLNDFSTDEESLPKSGGAMTGAITTNSTFDGRDVAADGVLATNALPKSGGTMTGNIAHAGAFTLDVGSEINLDSDSGYVYLKDAGTSIGLFKLTSSDFYIKNVISDKDIIFQGNDGGSGFEAMRIDMSAGGRLGIGVTAPDAKLDIEDTLQATANRHYSLVVGGVSGSDSVGNSSSILLSTTQGVTRGSSISAEKANVGNGHNLIFSTSASTATPTEAMRIDSTGQVVVGAAGSTWAAANMVIAEGTGAATSGYSALVIGNSNNATSSERGNGLMFISQNAAAGGAGFNDIYFTHRNNAGNGEGTSSRISSYKTSGADTSDLRFYTTNTQRMVIDSAGKLGLGTTDPAFDMGNRGIHIAGSTIPAIRLTSSTTGSADWEIYGSNSSTGGLGFYEHQNNQTHLYINESGNVGIGVNFVTPSQKLHVVGNIYNTGYVNTAGSGTAGGIQFADGNAMLYRDSNDLVFKLQGAESVRIKSDGKVGIGSDPSMGMLNIKTTGEFTTAYTNANGTGISMYSTDSAGAGKWGSAITWGALGGVNSHQAAIASVQTGSDANQVGLSMFTHNSTTGSAAMTEAIRISHNGNVGIGELSPDNLLHITSAGSDTTLIKLENTNADAYAARMTFVRSSSSVATDDDIGKIDFYAKDSAGNSDRYALMRAKIKDKTSGSEDGALIFSTVVAGSNVDTMQVSGGRVGIGTTQMNNGLNLPQGTGDDNRIGWSDGGGTRRGTIGVSSANDDMEFRIGSSSTLKVSVSSDGLLFNGDTAAANALDDYEEGTWSPTLIGATFANQTTTGRYVKIGNIVHIQYYTAAFNISSASGAARISNLPYAPLNVSGHHSVINYAHGTAVTGAAHIYLDHSNATMYFVTNDTTSSASWTNGNSKYVMISGTYQTA